MLPIPVPGGIISGTGAAAEWKADVNSFISEKGYMEGGHSINRDGESILTKYRWELDQIHTLS